MNGDSRADNHYEETQLFPAWAYAVLGGALLVQVVVAVAVPAARREATLPIMVGGLALVLNLLYFRTRVDHATLTVSFGWLFPLYRRRIPRSNIARAESVTYHPIREYGGWGIRGWGDDVALNARGNRGVRLTLTNRKRVLIGSQRPEALESALRADAPDR